jgi:hypothetical protein
MHNSTVPPQASHGPVNNGLLRFLAAAAVGGSVACCLKTEQEIEQNFRRMKFDTHSSWLFLPILCLTNVVPHHSQDFIGVCFAYVGISSYLRPSSLLDGEHTSHCRGNPMSQRLCAGFNCPPLSIPAEDPVSSCPVAVNRAGPVAIRAISVRL